jgi:hypothetical protein
MIALNHVTEMPAQQASGSVMSCTGKITVPKKPVARVSGAKMIVTTANRCMMMFMLLPCFVIARLILDKQLSCNDFNCKLLHKIALHHAPGATCSRFEYARASRYEKTDTAASKRWAHGFPMYAGHVLSPWVLFSTAKA